MKGRVTVRLKDGVLDVQGKAIAAALADLGFDSVSVRVARLFEVEVPLTDAAAAQAALDQMADQLLANPVMESYTVEIEEG
jgi:phosphoribosylformylglycinamidine synthase subunit PurS